MSELCIAQLYVVKYLNWLLGVATITSGPVNSEVLLGTFISVNILGSQHVHSIY